MLTQTRPHFLMAQSHMQILELLCRMLSFAKWKYPQVYNLLDILACVKMYFLQERRSCHYSMWRGPSEILVRIKTVFHSSLLYMFEQDPALTTTLSLSHTHMAAFFPCSCCSTFWFLHVFLEKGPLNLFGHQLTTHLYYLACLFFLKLCPHCHWLHLASASYPILPSQLCFLSCNVSNPHPPLLLFFLPHTISMGDMCAKFLSLPFWIQSPHIPKPEMKWGLFWDEKERIFALWFRKVDYDGPSKVSEQLNRTRQRGCVAFCDFQRYVE